MVAIWILMALAGAFIISLLLVAIIFKGEIRACFERDPAAVNFFEVVLTYSGLHALIFHRIAHALLKMKIPLLPRFISQAARGFTGVEIHPGAKVGKGVFIDHGMGVVIGETSVVGDNVTIFQGVTLGGTGKVRGKRHPTVGNNVVIGTGAKILGNITVGDNSYVGANAVVIKDVPQNSTVVGVPGRITKQEGRKIDIKLDHIHILDPVLQEIEEIKKRLGDLERKYQRVK